MVSVCTPDGCVTSQIDPQTVSDVKVGAPSVNSVELQLDTLTQTPLLEYVTPCVHEAQLLTDVAPTTTDPAPAAHELHADADNAAVDDDHVPALQEKQARLEVAEIEDDQVPALHATHDGDVPPVEYVPAAHLTQFLEEDV